MRAQEWIPSAPMHKIMYDALGWEMPELCHLPMVLGPDGHKLSKRHGATAVNEFKKAGYLPEALINYIALLGCSYEDGRDIYSLDELVRLFRIDRLNKAPAVFDYQKLEWFNGQYIRMKSDKELAELIRPYLISAGLRKEEDPQKDRMELAAIPFIKERLKLLGDSPAIMSYLYKRLDMPAAEEFVPKKASIDEAIMYLEECRSILESSNLDDLPAIEEKFRERATVIGKKLGDILMPLRVAITYSRVSPPLFESMRILGKDECIKRIEAAVAYLRGA